MRVIILLSVVTIYILGCFVGCESNNLTTPQSQDVVTIVQTYPNRVFNSTTIARVKRQRTRRPNTVAATKVNGRKQVVDRNTTSYAINSTENATIAEQKYMTTEKTMNISNVSSVITTMTKIGITKRTNSTIQFVPITTIRSITTQSAPNSTTKNGRTNATRTSYAATTSEFNSTKASGVTNTTTYRTYSTSSSHFVYNITTTTTSVDSEDTTENISEEYEDVESTVDELPKTTSHPILAETPQVSRNLTYTTKSQPKLQNFTKPQLNYSNVTTYNYTDSQTKIMNTTKLQFINVTSMPEKATTIRQNTTKMLNYTTGGSILNTTISMKGNLTTQTYTRNGSTTSYTTTRQNRTIETTAKTDKYTVPQLNATDNSTYGPTYPTSKFNTTSQTTHKYIYLNLTTEAQKNDSRTSYTTFQYNKTSQTSDKYDRYSNFSTQSPYTQRYNSTASHNKTSQTTEKYVITTESQRNLSTVSYNRSSQTTEKRDYVTIYVNLTKESNLTTATRPSYTTQNFTYYPVTNSTRSNASIATTRSTSYTTSNFSIEPTTTDMFENTDFIDMTSEIEDTTEVIEDTEFITDEIESTTPTIYLEQTPTTQKYIRSNYTTVDNRTHATAEGYRNFTFPANTTSQPRFNITQFQTGYYHINQTTGKVTTAGTSAFQRTEVTTEQTKSRNMSIPDILFTRNYTNATQITSTKRQDTTHSYNTTKKFDQTTMSNLTSNLTSYTTKKTQNVTMQTSQPTLISSNVTQITTNHSTKHTNYTISRAVVNSTILTYIVPNVTFSGITSNSTIRTYSPTTTDKREIKNTTTTTTTTTRTTTTPTTTTTKTTTTSTTTTTTTTSTATTTTTTTTTKVTTRPTTSTTTESVFSVSSKPPKQETTTKSTSTKYVFTSHKRIDDEGMKNQTLANRTIDSAASENGAFLKIGSRLKEIILISTASATIALFACFSVFMLWFCCFGAGAKRRKQRKGKVAQAADDLSSSPSPQPPVYEKKEKIEPKPQSPFKDKLKAQLSSVDLIKKQIKRPDESKKSEDKANLLVETVENEENVPTYKQVRDEIVSKKSKDDEKSRSKSGKSDVVMVSEATSPIDMSLFEDKTPISVDRSYKTPQLDKSKLSISKVQIESYEGKVSTLLEKVNEAYIDDTDEELSKVIKNKSFNISNDNKNDNNKLLANVLLVNEASKSDAESSNLNPQYSFISTTNSIPIAMSRALETRGTETDNGCITSSSKCLQVSKEEIENELYLSSPENIKKQSPRGKLRTVIQPKTSFNRESFKTPLLFRKKGEKNFIERNKFMVSEMSFVRSSRPNRTSNTKNDQSWH